MLRRRVVVPQLVLGDSDFGVDRLGWDFRLPDAPWVCLGLLLVRGVARALPLLTAWHPLPPPAAAGARAIRRMLPDLDAEAASLPSATRRPLSRSDGLAAARSTPTQCRLRVSREQRRHQTRNMSAARRGDAGVVARIRITSKT